MPTCIIYRLLRITCMLSKSISHALTRLQFSKLPLQSQSQSIVCIWAVQSGRWLLASRTRSSAFSRRLRRVLALSQSSGPLDCPHAGTCRRRGLQPPFSQRWSCLLKPRLQHLLPPARLMSLRQNLDPTTMILATPAPSQPGKQLAFHQTRVAYHGNQGTSCWTGTVQD